MRGSPNLPKSGTSSNQRDCLGRKQFTFSDMVPFHSTRGSIGLCWLVDLCPVEGVSHLVIWRRSNSPISSNRVFTDFRILSPSVWYRRWFGHGTLSDNNMVLG